MNTDKKPYGLLAVMPSVNYETDNNSMYINITKSFLSNITKSFLVHTFKTKGSASKKTKNVLVDEIYDELTPKVKGKRSVPILLTCEFCRTIGFLAVPEERGSKGLKYCVACGRLSSYNVFIENIERTKKLVKLASKMNTKDESDDKAILLEQSIVSLATSVEVLLRESYSIIIDLTHVVFGKSIYKTIYKNSKNDFTNIGVATNNFKKSCQVDIKNSLGEEKYNLIRAVYSTRHAIVHNSGIKDAEYISQTNGRKEDIGKRITLTVSEIRRTITALKSLGILIDSVLKNSLIEFLEERGSVVGKIRK